MNKRYLVYLPVIFIIPLLLLVCTLWPGDAYTGYIADPVQVGLGDGQVINILGDEGYVSLSLLASYNIEAVVKSTNRLRDYPSQVSRYDLALAWGDLNRGDIDDTISYSQGTRCYTYRWSADTPVTPAYIASHSANVHIIHSDKNTLKKVRAIDKNDHIRLQGYLVQVNFPYGPWRSSLTRTDTGNGACEIMYVTDVQVLN
ncbi:MAG: hypothetical protein ABRQ24_06750 [Syntrophomonadaceae bacterium]